MEWDLKLKAEDRSVALQRRADQDVEAITSYPGSETSYSRLQKGSTQSAAWSVRSTTGPFESATRRIRWLTPSGRILEPR